MTSRGTFTSPAGSDAAATGSKAGQGQSHSVPKPLPASPGPYPRVAGLDLSMTATGICLPDGSTHTIRTIATHRDRRLRAIAEAIANAVLQDGHACDLAVIEEAPPGLKGAAIKTIHMVHGAVRLTLIDAQVPYAVVNPRTLKAYATGDLAADKTAMAMAAYKRAQREFPDDKGGDQCDAWWLRAAGLDHLAHPEVTLPKAQRERLNTVTWPEPAR